MRLTEQVYVIGGGSLGYGISSPYDCNVYAVDSGDEVILIDAGSGIEPELMLQQLELDGIPLHKVTKLLLTHAHADHSGGAYSWKESLNVSVIAPEWTSEMVESGDEIRTSLDSARKAGIYPSWYRLQACSVDRKIRAGERIHTGTLTLQAIPAPGHSFDMYCYYCPELKALFAADAVFADEGKLAIIGTPDFSLADYRTTIAALAELDVEQLYPGHGAALIKHGREPIRMAQRRFKEGNPQLSIV